MANQLLLVDDSPLIHRVVELTFEGQDFLIHSADTPEQAFALARTVKPDIVVASAEMKGGGGPDICRRLLQEGDLGETPVLLLTSVKSQMSEGEARQAGAAAVLVKPFEPERLLAEVGRILARAGLDKEGGPPGAAPSEPPEQESPSGQELFEDHEIDSLFTGGPEEHPAEMPQQARDDSDLLQAEKVLDQGDAAGGGTPPQEGQNIPLFDDSELDELFAEEVPEESASPAAAAEPGADWADFDLEAGLAAKPPDIHGDLADFATEQANAAEAQLAELEAELASAPAAAPSEDEVRAAESRLENIREELSRELSGAGHIEMPKRPLEESAPPASLESDDDLLELAAEAGFGGPGRPRPGPDFPAGLEPEIEAEPVAEEAAEEDPAAASKPGGDFAVDEFEPEGASFPGEEAPVWDIPLEESGIPEAEPEPRRTNDSGHEASGVEPLVQQSLERTVEAIVPALIRNIEALVVRQLPDLVEKIVLREIDKIKRGE